jgi:hypothetical protein
VYLGVAPLDRSSGKRVEGKTHMQVLRALARHILRILFRMLSNNHRDYRLPNSQDVRVRIFPSNRFVRLYLPGANEIGIAIVLDRSGECSAVKAVMNRGARRLMEGGFRREFDFEGLFNRTARSIG